MRLLYFDKLEKQLGPNVEKKLATHFPGLDLEDYMAVVTAYREEAAKLGEECRYSSTFFHLYQWLRGGRKIYVVTDTLGWLLAHTDCTIDATLIRLPFPSICIQIPRGLFFMSSDKPDRYDVTEVVIREGKLTKDFREMSFFFIGRPENQPIVYDSAVAVMSTHMAMKQEGKFKSTTHRIRDGLNSSMFLTPARNTLGSTPEGAADLTEKLFYFIVNCLLYTTSADADMEWDPAFRKLWDQRKKAKKQHQIDRINRNLAELGSPRKLLGGKIIISRQDREDYMQSFRTGKTTIGVRFQVSGHWRQQWYGSEKTGNHRQQPKWIQPYWKGPEAAEVVNKIRELR